MSSESNNLCGKDFDHDWAKTENDNNTNSDSKKAVIVVGSSGLGKSSTIGLFCGNNKPKTSSSTDSTTKDASLWIDKSDNLIWVDTQGTNDSSDSISDNKILLKIMKKLYDEKINKIKVLWFVPRDGARANFNGEAKFIKDLLFEDKNSTNKKQNIWNSVIIIQKKADFIPEPDDIKGIWKCASNNGSTIDYEDDANELYSIGFKCIDWMDKTNKKTKKIMKKNYDARVDDGYLYGNEIKTELKKRLNKLSYVKIEWCHRKCEKCYKKGDPRLFIAEKCHYKDYCWDHPDGQEQYHSSGGYWKHNGSFKVDTTGRVFAGIFTLGISEAAKWGKWSCCDGRKGSSGCKYYYYCCNDWGTSGCKVRYKCCWRSSSDSGCKKKCKHCKNFYGTKGCHNKNDKDLGDCDH